MNRIIYSDNEQGVTFELIEAIVNGKKTFIVDGFTTHENPENIDFSKSLSWIDNFDFEMYDDIVNGKL